MRKEALALGLHVHWITCIPALILTITAIETCAARTCGLDLASSINDGELPPNASKRSRFLFRFGYQLWAVGSGLFGASACRKRPAGVVCMDVANLYQFLYVLLSILGTCVSPYFFSAHLLDIALQNAILQV